jgi:hypothetical protein
MISKSEFEDGPEPERAARERLLGAGLLLIVLAIAAASWARGEHGRQAYREGVRAEGARQWTTAAAAFTSAADWQDAPSRAAHATAQARQLAALIQAGQAAAGRGDWPAAVQAYRAAVPLDHVDSTLAPALTAARQALQRTGLAGLVILRSVGPAPGLYLDGAYLTGSDAESRLRAIAGDGRRFIYDRGAAPGQIAPPAAPRADFWIPAHGLTGTREAVLAEYVSGAAPRLRPLPPAVDGRGMGLFLGDTLWWYTPRSDYGYYSYAITYFDLQTGAQGLIADASGRLTPLAQQPDGRAGAMARYSSVPPGADPRATIFLSDPHGAPGLTLGQVDGTVGASGFSADGRFLVVQTVGRGSARHSLYLTDLHARHPSLQMIESLTVPAAAAGGLTAVWLGADDRLLIDAWDDAGERLELYRPGDEMQRTAWATLWQGPPRPPAADLAAVSPDGAGLAWRALGAGGDQIWLAGRAGGAVSRPIPARAGDSLEMAFAPHGDYLVFGGYRLDDRPGARQMSIYSLPITGGGAPLRLGERLWDPQLPSLALPAAGTLVAVVAPDHTLHGLTYDGRLDLPAVTGVAAVWSLGAPSRGWAH